MFDNTTIVRSITQGLIQKIHEAGGGGREASQNVLASKIVTIYFTENSLKLIQVKTSKKMGEGAECSPLQWHTPKSTHANDQPAIYVY